MVVGVSCSVVGPKRYERWGVLEHHPPAWVFAAAKLFLVGISNKVLNKLKKKTKEG